jgi:hypothetical protein
MDLVIMPETSMAKLETSTFQVDTNSPARVRVKVRKIDAMIAGGEIVPPSLMKIDVEGAEAMVLRGARETIRRHRPIIFAEVHSAALLSECRALLETDGYRIEMIDPSSANALSKDVVQIKAAPGACA